jgi:hypothetical protein
MSTNWFNSKTKKRLAIGVSFAISGVLYLKVLSPKLGIHIPCIFHEVTNLHCPGCGITRVCLSLLKGDFEQAFHYNMLVFVLAPLLLTYIVLEKKGLKRTANVMMMVSITLTLIFWVLRNTLMFDWLAPTKID